MAAVLFVGGVELIMLGMVGLYVAAILDQVKDRPRYLVESTIGFDDDQHVGYRDREI
jgi:dolichol-phosphate mannosyltransferase